MKTAKKITTYFALTLLLGAMFLSLFQLSMGTSMSGGMSDCPFMTDEETLCPMNLIDHITAWKSTFQSAVPSAINLLTLLGSVILITSVAPNLRQKIILIFSVLYLRLRLLYYTYTYRPLQDLFSSGILNPKLF